MSDHLRAPIAKIRRTYEQIAEFERDLADFIARKRYELEVIGDRELDIDIWRFKFDKFIPDDFSVITGEILHNLRSALEQCLVETCIQIGSKSESGISFPFGNCVQEFESALNRQKKIPCILRSYISELKPYLGGNDILWILHETNRRDKHRIGLVPVNLGVGGTSTFLSIWYGQGLSWGPRTGQHLVAERRMTSGDYVKYALAGQVWGAYGTGGVNLLTGLPENPIAGAYIHFENHPPFDEDNSFEFLTTTPGSKILTDLQPLFNISLKTKGIVKGTPIIKILTDIRHIVINFISHCEKNFF